MYRVVRALAVALLAASPAISPAGELRPFQLPSASPGRYVVPVQPQAAPQAQPLEKRQRDNGAAERSQSQATDDGWKKQVDQSTEQFDQLLKSLDR